MFLDHDSPLLQPSPHNVEEPLPRLEPPEPSPAEPERRIIELSFDRAGSLGIEFKELAAPFVVEHVHSTGLAYGKDLQKGDRLIQVAGEDVGDAKWDDLVQKLTTRPVLVAFERPEAAQNEGLAKGLGFGTILSAASGGFGLAGKMGSAGLELTNKVSAGLDLGTQLGSQLTAGAASAAAAASGLLGGDEAEELARLREEVKNMKAAAPENDLQLELQRMQEEMKSMAGLREQIAQLQQALEKTKADAAIESQTLQQETHDAKNVASRAKSELETLQGELQAARANGAESATLAQELSDARQAAAQAKSDLESLQLELQAARANGAESATLAQELSDARQAAAQAKSDLEALQVELQAARANGAESATLAQELSDARQAAAQAKSDLEALQQSAQSAENAWQEQVDALKRSEDDVRAQLMKAQQSLPDPNQVSDLQSEVTSLQQQLQGSKDALTVMQRELQASQQQSRELQAAKGELEKMHLPTMDLEAEVQALRAEVQRLQGEADSSKEPPQPETIEVLFALPGSLGLEFQAQQAPYVIAKIHDSGVAVNLGIRQGDELIAVADEPVENAGWEELVRKLSTRPVVGKFRRPAPVENTTAPAKLWSSVGSMGASLLTAARGAEGAAENERLRGDLERLQETVQTKDSQLLELESRIKQKEEALHVALSGVNGNDAAVATAALAEEKSRLQQQLQQLETQLREAQRQVAQRTEESLRYRASYEEEARQKEEQRQTSISLQDRCNSLMKQFESLSATCQNLTMDSQQKVGLEGQVNELLRMNAQWQQAHQSLNAESESMRQRLLQVEQLQLEVRRLESFEAVARDTELRLQETERSLDEHRQALIEAQQLRSHDSGALQRLQLEMESLQENSESQVGQLEAELMESSSAKVRLQREKDDLQHRLEELLHKQQENSQAAEDGHALRHENQKLQQELAMAQEEQKTLNGVVERCLAKMEIDSRERPFLVDKRMVTQMLAAYLEQAPHPKAQQEILTKMADLLGFSTSEREQVGLSQKRRGPLSEEPANFSDLTDRFVDFLMEESEAD